MTNSDYQLIAVVPAAGIGSRMQADKPKQYLEIQGKTILAHTLGVLFAYPAISEIIVAVAPNDPYLPQLKFDNAEKIRFVHGGATRAESVLNGLHHINAKQRCRVLVHDAARPCLTHQDLDRLLQIDDDNGAILAIPATDTIKRADAAQQIHHTEDRAGLWLAQTPQYFRADLLQNALEQALAQGLAVTDEASAMEFAGFRPHLVPGRSDNLKITRPEDLALAEFYLNRKNTTTSQI
ncbi:2-C-methyl-D-erythritol 4-phosphate cytidylyltransferase [Caviibacterium pharyngocola]|uniref:2-C-methyl-D-erythritol 4-phosphate cytidylyltransferase n=1 Tax=Caviibacterium pharyngocola TaxID=28159 RepID=A0A2M8RXU8_9PAST|nr:2-C-methyl-D-erythritol 4-phosphate cytidylyltransferase [Caviibacterium pharyngocola]PJG83702.1 2-C-methyl-D-erythritol 4-phosphate cytidylyltransferase [Caviibacterium pharyngocola]